MAKTTITQITDDIDGSKDAATYRFAWESTEYEIDLSNKNFKAFHKAIEPYLDAATKVGGGRKKPISAKKRTDMSDVRAWARDNGFDVSERGRIPAEVLNAYDAR